MKLHAIREKTRPWASNQKTVRQTAAQTQLTELAICRWDSCTTFCIH